MTTPAEEVGGIAEALGAADRQGRDQGCAVLSPDGMEACTWR